MDSRQLGTIIRRVHRSASGPQRAGLPDAELLRRFAEQRDEAAFETLLWRHGSMVYAVCRRLLRHPQDAEDAFQATFLILVRKAAGVGRRGSVGGWLYRVAYRVALEARARAARRAAGEFPVERLPARDATDDVTWRDLRPVLDDELNRLPEKYRAPFVLCCLEGRTQEEVARELHCPKGTVSTRLTRARELLRARLTRRGLAPSAGALAVALPQRLMPARVLDAALAAATASGTGRAPAMALADRALATLFAARLRTVAAVLALAALTAGLGWAGRQALTRPAPEAEAVAPAARTDRHGDPLPTGAVARLGTVRFRHPGLVTATAFTRDGRTIATGCRDGAVRLWDAATGREVRRLNRPLTWGDLLGESPPWVYALSLSPDGRAVVASYGSGLLCLWDARTGQPLRRLTGHRGVVRSVSFSPDGQTIASTGDDKTVRLWQAATGRELRRFQGRRRYVAWSVAFAPDGKTLATGGDAGELFLWDVGTGTELRACRGHQGPVQAVQFSPDGQALVSGAYDGTVRLWETATGRERRRLLDSSKTSDRVWSVSFSPGGDKVAAADTDGTIRVWDAGTGRETCRVAIDWSTAGFTLAFSPDGKALALGDGSSVGLWDAVTGRPLLPPDGHHYAVGALAFSPDGKLLASGSHDRTVALWDPAAGELVRRLVGHRAAVHGVSFAPDGRRLASIAEGALCLWDLPSGKPAREVRGYANSYLAVAFSPDGKTLAAPGESGLAHLWDPTTRRERCRLGGRQDMVYSLAFSPDGALLACGGRVPPAVTHQGYDDDVVVWSVAERREVCHFDRRDNLVAPVAFSPRGNVLVSGSVDGGLRLWELATRGERCRFSVPTGETPAVAFSPDGGVLAVGCPDGTIRLWDLATGTRCGWLAAGQGGVLSVVFSPDGRRLASGGMDSTVLLWDVAAVVRPRQPSAADLTPAETDRLWDDLASADAARGYRALCRLATAPRQAVALVRRELRPASPPDRQRVGRLIGDLDDERFAVRQKATAELEALGELAVPALREALDRRPSPEAARRLRELLDHQEEGTAPPERLRALRSVELLEAVGTPEARQVLEALAGGAPEAHLSREARAALNRLARRPAPGP